ncbi:hypothetical protein GCM10025864_11610 [Luteimicrobium album]|uniref:Uncharacterized protein n=1 Tax=Luteimicrobium album TaxID=1054550 RepID=A0ABQ6HZJ3_9MICO|nr:hypothetical protein [Luteimicrobium album]GMA23402.1 hypothetical protein GCM10025864_11610 [Luteimicrobium album]
MPLDLPATTPVRPRRLLRRTTALVASVTVAIGLAGAVGAGTATAAPKDATAAAASDGPFVLVGTGGVQPEDVSATTTPNIWKALGGTPADGSDPASADLVGVAPGVNVVRTVRSSTCPVDGWLAVSSGRRAGDIAPHTQPTCRVPDDPTDSSTDGTGGTVPDWAEYQDAVAHQSFDATLGALGDAVEATGLATTSIGPGAAIAVATKDGTVAGTHVDAPADVTGLENAVTTALGTSRLVVVDAGAVLDPAAQPGEEPLPAEEVAASHAKQVKAVDANVGAVLAAVTASPGAADTSVLVASLADSNRTSHLQLALGAGPALSTHGDASGGHTILAAGSTRQPGMIQDTDVLPTVVHAVGIGASVPESATVGTTIGTARSDASGTDRLDGLVDVSRHASAVKPLIANFYLLLILANLALYAFATVLLRLDAKRLGAVGRWLRENPSGVLKGLVAVGIALGSIPVSTTLANAFPWWRASAPAWTLAGIVVALDVVITAVAMLVPWRRAPLWPFGVVGGVTAVVLAIDVLGGAPLQLSGLMGTQPLVAGRFYGINNTSYALFGTACVMVTVALANPLVLRGRRKAAAGVVAVVGVVATALDGLPSIGADFGGPRARRRLRPARPHGGGREAHLAARRRGPRGSGRRGRRVRRRGLAATPDQRTHLGRFVDDVLHGELWHVVQRKLAQNLDNLNNNLTLVALAGLLVVVYVLGRPLRGALAHPAGGPLEWITTDAPLSQLTAYAPMLRPGIITTGVILGIGFLVNDSGILVPATGIVLALPVLLAVYANWLRDVRARGGAAAPRPRSDAPAAR